MCDLPLSGSNDDLVGLSRARLALIRYGVDSLGMSYYSSRTSDALVHQEYDVTSVVMHLTALLDGLGKLVNHLLPEVARLPDHQVTLSPRRRGFCSIVKPAFPEIAEQWQQSRPFLVLLYEILRNPIAHAAVPVQLAHYHSSRSEGQSAGTIGVKNCDGVPNLNLLRKQCGETDLPYEWYTSLGFSREDFHGTFKEIQQLEPYLFCREAWSRVKRLVNGTLLLVGYHNALGSVGPGMSSPEQLAAMFRETEPDGLELTSMDHQDPFSSAQYEFL